MLKDCRIFSLYTVSWCIMIMSLSLRTQSYSYIYHLESRWGNYHALVYHGCLLGHLLGVAPSFTTVYSICTFANAVRPLPRACSCSLCSSNFSSKALARRAQSASTACEVFSPLSKRLGCLSWPMRQNKKAALPKCQTYQSSSRINLSCERKTSKKLQDHAGEHEQQGRFATVFDGFQICRV